jgi:hypothetical protein
MGKISSPLISGLGMEKISGPLILAILEQKKLAVR